MTNWRIRCENRSIWSGFYRIMEGKVRQGLYSIVPRRRQGQTTAAVGLTVSCAGRRKQGRSRSFSARWDFGRVPRAGEIARPRPLWQPIRSAGASFRMTDAEKRETADALTRTRDAAPGLSAGSTARLLVLDEVCAAISCGFLDEKRS